MGMPWRFETLASRQGEVNEAILWYERSLELFQRFGRHDIDTAGALADLSDCYMLQGRLGDAIDCASRALECYDQTP
jgi:tetratricopeptide (TPR) repeat protein